MIRRLLALATPLAAVGLGAGFVAPSLFAGAGAPMLVSGDPDGAVQAAAFEGEGCISDLSLRAAAPAQAAGGRISIDLVPLREPAGAFAVMMRRADAASGPAYVVVFSSEGRIVAVRQTAAMADVLGQAASLSCRPEAADRTLHGKV